MAFNFDPAGRTLKGIEQQFSNKPEECCREMFQKWLKTKDASWKSLIAALESSGEDLLADYVKAYIGLAQGERDFGITVDFSLLVTVHTRIGGPNN